MSDEELSDEEMSDEEMSDEEMSGEEMSGEEMSGEEKEPAMSSEEFRALLERGADRDLDELEARRLETALASDPTLLESLLDDPALDELLGDEPVPLPTDLEWKRIDSGIEAGIGAGSMGTGAPRVALWKVLVPLAAAAVLCAVVIRSIVNEGLAVPASPIVEVDLPDDRPYLILPAEGEDGGVMIYITSG